LNGVKPPLAPFPFVSRRTKDKRTTALTEFVSSNALVIALVVLAVIAIVLIMLVV